MEMKNIYQNAKEHLGKIVFLPFVMLGLSGCGEVIDKPIHSEERNKKIVTIYDVENTGFNLRDIDGTKIVFSDKSGKIEKILYDDKTGKLGDEYYDYVEIYQEDGTKIKYASTYYINEKGQEIRFESGIGKKLKSLINGKLEEYDKEYQEIMTKMSKSIEEKL